MASQKLRDSDRREIIRAAIEKAFAEKDKQLAELDEKVKEAGEKAEKLAYEVIPADFRKKMAALPAGFLPTQTYIQFVTKSGDGRTANFGCSRPVPEICTFGSERSREFLGPIDDDHPWILADKECRAAVHERDKFKTDLEAEKDVLRKKIRGILESVTTTGRLLQVWPEAESLMKKAELVPAVSIAEINAAVGLP